MTFKFTHKKRKFSVDTEKCSSAFSKFRGLMFRKKENSHPLLFEFKSPTMMPIHSMFVFFNFFAVWLDDKDNVILIEKVKPWKISVRPSGCYSKLLEIPCNEKYKGIIRNLTFSRR